MTHSNTPDYRNKKTDFTMTEKTLTSDVRRLEKGNSKNDGADNKQKPDDTLGYISAFELLKFLEVPTEPMILYSK